MKINQSAFADAVSDHRTLEKRHADESFFAKAGLWPADLRVMIAQAFDLSPSRVGVIQQNGDPMRYEIAYNASDFSDEYEIDFRERRVRQGLLTNMRRDRMTGRKMFAWRSVVGLLLDFQEATIRASMTMGGYSWAKSGVRARNTANISMVTRARLKEIAAQLDAQQYAYVDELSRLQNPDDLQKLALLDTPITNAARYFDRVIPEPYSFDSYRKLNLFQSDTITLGQFLLAGQKYFGYIDLKDAGHIQTISAYCGVDIAQTAQDLNRSKQRAGYSSTRAFQTARPL